MFKHLKLLFLIMRLFGGFLILNIINCNGFVLPTIYKTSISRVPLHSTKTPADIIKELSYMGQPGGEPWTYNDYLSHLEKKDITGVSLLTDHNVLNGAIAIDKIPSGKELLPENMHIIKTNPLLLERILEQLEKKKINFDFIDITHNGFLDSIPLPLQLLGYYLIGGIIIRTVFGVLSQNNPNQFGNPLQSMMSSSNDKVNIEDVSEKFTDVAGCEEAKEELTEIVDFLKNPLKYQAAGAKIPRGVLLEGPPGTGKTLLARAVAGEAGVNFFSASGSQFVEMFVGVGASRVRELFKKANDNSPCVIFIDEIDAVGRQRGTGIAGGNDEREQTLNQILTNMDGFDRASGIIVLGATNRADILDNALIRPGRFDRKITVGLPDEIGRREIIDVHFKNKNVYNNNTLDKLSTLTSGFSGADIANLANEAAILSVRYNKTSITDNCLYDAYEKMTIGLPTNRETRPKQIIKMVAYHETGHAIMALLFKDLFDLQKITIISNKNGAGGYTLFTPKPIYDGFPTKKFMLANMITALGGRAAEVILFNTTNNQSDLPYDNSIFNGIKQLDVTTGASNDLKQANTIARKYISLFGLGRNIATYDTQDTSQPFLGRELAGGGNKMSEFSKEEIDKEISELVNFAYKTAINIIQYNIDEFNDIANLLLKYKTINQDTIIENNINIKYKYDNLTMTIK
jgi:cell division protease FtsH